MISLRRLIIVGSLMSTIHLGYTVPVKWRIEDGGNGHLYELIGNHAEINQRWTWTESKAMAEALGGHLVTITSAAENQFLIETFHVNHKLPTWIGLTDSELFGGTESLGQPNPMIDGWVWVTGETVTFTGWNAGNPDNVNNEDFALMGSVWGDTHAWNDGQDSWHAAFFVEYEPRGVPDATSTATLLSLAALALLSLPTETRRTDSPA